MRIRGPNRCERRAQIGFSKCDHKSHRTRIIAEYGQSLRNDMLNGWTAYLLTFMFNQLRRENGPVIVQMNNEVERFYRTLVTRVVRNPRSIEEQHLMPQLNALPDAPFYKNRKYRYNIRDVTINGGLHVHGIIRIPQVSRLKQDLHLHVAENRDGYINSRPALHNIDIVRIDSNPEYVTDYAFKAFKNGRVDHDDAIVLPKSISELPDRRWPES